MSRTALSRVTTSERPPHVRYLTTRQCMEAGDAALQDALTFAQPPTEEEIRQHGDNLGAELFSATCASAALATAWYAKAAAMKP